MECLNDPEMDDEAIAIKSYYSKVVLATCNHDNMLKKVLDYIGISAQSQRCRYHLMYNIKEIDHSVEYEDIEALIQLHQMIMNAEFFETRVPKETKTQEQYLKYITDSYVPRLFYRNGYKPLREVCELLGDYYVNHCPEAEPIKEKCSKIFRQWPCADSMNSKLL